MIQKRNYLYGVLLLFTVCSAQAQDYPFPGIPDNITATLDVQTSTQEAFLNPLLGYNIFGFNSSSQKDLIRGFNPTTVRFPHGLYANWYDWREDKTRVFGTETFYYNHRDSGPKEVTIGELDAINYFDRNDIKVGIDGMAKLNSERELTQGKGFDVIWTFNMSADNESGAGLDESPETVARYEDLIARGFEVKDVELGNECFYPSQRSSFIPNASDYIARAKSMAQALKAKDPNLKVSIPLLRRGSFVNPTWNADLTQDLTYFDAVTVHTYIGADPDNGNNSDEAFSTALTARKSLETSTNDFVRIYTGDKPIWLTEWGVKSGGPNAASILGMADCYLFMAENQDIYQRANWFSVNGKLNSFVVWEGNSIKYPLEKTANGLTHEILKNVFENSTMLESTITTENLIDGVKAVSARAVTKDGITTVFVLNLTDKSVPFTLNIDGTLYSDNFIHKAMQFDNVGQERNLPFDEDPLNLIKEGSGAISLPPLSISTIVLGNDDVELPTVELIAPLAYSSHISGEPILIQATASANGATINQVDFKINDILHSTDTTFPYESTFIPTEKGTYKLSAIVTDSNNKTNEVFNLIYVVEQEPFFGIPTSIPGILECEDYDKGGQDVAYNDNEPENRGGAYRLSEGVDVGKTTEGGFSVGYVASGEWIEYTVDVQEAGDYDMIIKYSSGRSGGGTLSASTDGNALFSGFALSQTGGWGDYQVLTEEAVALSQGEQILRLVIAGGGYNLDSIEFNKSTLSVEKFELNKFSVYPNPSQSGLFSITKSIKWTVYSLSGAKLLEGHGDAVDLSSFSKGLYILKGDSGMAKRLIYK